MVVNPFNRNRLWPRNLINQGFTLIELIVGIVVLSLAILLLSSLLYPQTDNAAKTLHSSRAAELALSIYNEISLKRYDENTADGGIPACNATGTTPAPSSCSSSAQLGPDSGESSHDDYDDVDDYNGFTIDDTVLNNSCSLSSCKYSDLYKGYQLEVSVVYHTPNTNSKLIVINVTTPAGDSIMFNAVRSNY